MPVFLTLVNIRYWKLVAVGFGILLSFLLSTPQGARFSDSESYWKTVEMQSRNPLTPTTVDKHSHAAKKIFRLTVPLMARFLHLDRKGIYLLQCLLMPLMLLMILDLSYTLTQDKLSSVVFMAACISLYFLYSTYQDNTGHLDAFAYFFLLSAIYFTSPVLIFISCFLASWCDERAFVATFLVLGWWYLRRDETLHAPASLLPDRRSMAVIISALTYTLLRIWLQKFTGLSIQLDRYELFLVTNFFHLLPALTLIAYGAFWLLILYLLYTLVRRKNFLQIALLFIPAAVIFLIACMVWDFSRSISFSFPIIFAGLYALKVSLPVDKMRQVLMSIFALSVITPTIQFDSQWYHYPSVFFVIFQKVILKFQALLSPFF